jgi:hypothetical protein
MENTKRIHLLFSTEVEELYAATVKTLFGHFRWHKYLRGHYLCLSHDRVLPKIQSLKVLPWFLPLRTKVKVKV